MKKIIYLSLLMLFSLSSTKTFAQETSSSQVSFPFDLRTEYVTYQPTVSLPYYGETNPINLTVTKGSTSTALLTETNSNGVLDYTFPTQGKYTFTHTSLGGSSSTLNADISYVSPVIADSESIEFHIPHYLCFTAEEAGTGVQFNVHGEWTPTATLQYSRDEVNWYNYTFGTAKTLANVGDKIYFKATTTNDSFSKSTSCFIYFSSTKKVSASGNVMSLLDESCRSNEVPEYAFAGLFWKSPITTAPEFPATLLHSYCYYSTFQNCNNLTVAPELPSPILAKSCYHGMFYKCSGLKTVPELPAPTLVEDCYGAMFSYCTLLDSITVKFLDWNEAENATTNWMESAGTDNTVVHTFNCLNRLNTSVRDASHVPAGWTIRPTYEIIHVTGSNNSTSVNTLTEAEEPITVSLDTDQKFSALQFNVTLPENVKYVEGSATAGSILADGNFDILVNKNELGQYVFVITTNNMEAFKTNTDVCDIVTFRIKTNSAVADDNKIIISDVSLSTHTIPPTLLDINGAEMDYSAKLLIRGDADMDRVVTVNDYNWAKHYALNLMEMPVSYSKEFLSADANEDGEDAIDVADAQAIVGLIQGVMPDRAKPFISGAQSVEGLNFIQDGNQLCIMADNAEQFLGCQMDIILPQGVKVISKKSDVNHSIASNDVNGAYRILVTSQSGSTFNSKTIATLTLSEESEVSTRNIAFANTSYQSIKTICPTTITGIADARSVKSNVENGKFVQNGKVIIKKGNKTYNIDGQTVK